MKKWRAQRASHTREREEKGCWISKKQRRCPLQKVLAFLSEKPCWELHSSKQIPTRREANPLQQCFLEWLFKCQSLLESRRNNRWNMLLETPSHEGRWMNVLLTVTLWRLHQNPQPKSEEALQNTRTEKCCGSRRGWDRKRVWLRLTGKGKILRPPYVYFLRVPLMCAVNKRRQDAVKHSLSYLFTVTYPVSLRVRNFVFPLSPSLFCRANFSLTFHV